MGGIYVSGTAISVSTQANVVSVACSLSSQLFLGVNTSRKGMIIFNGAIYDLFVKFGSLDGVSPTNFTIVIPANGTYESPTSVFCGDIWGAWDQYDGEGKAQITELW